MINVRTPKGIFELGSDFARMVLQKKVCRDDYGTTVVSRFSRDTFAHVFLSRAQSADVWKIFMRSDSDNADDRGT